MYNEERVVSMQDIFDPEQYNMYPDDRPRGHFVTTTDQPYNYWQHSSSGVSRLRPNQYAVLSRISEANHPCNPIYRFQLPNCGY